MPPSQEADDDVPTGTSERDLLLWTLRRADKKRDEHTAALRDLTGALKEHNAAAAARHAATLSTFTDAMNRQPGRWEFRALGGVLAIAFMVMLGLLAQSKGLDAGKAAEDARKALGATNAAAAPAASQAAPPCSPEEGC